MISNKLHNLFMQSGIPMSQIVQNGSSSFKALRLTTRLQLWYHVSPELPKLKIETRYQDSTEAAIAYASQVQVLLTKNRFEKQKFK